MEAILIDTYFYDSDRGEMRNTRNSMIGKPEAKITWLSCRYEDNIKIDLKELGYKNVGWIHVVQDRILWRALVSTALNHGALKKTGNFLIVW